MLRTLLYNEGRRSRVGRREAAGLYSGHGCLVADSTVFGQLRLHSTNSISRDGFGHVVVSEEPQSEVDVVNRHVNKHTTSPGGVVDKEACRATPIDTLGCPGSNDFVPASCPSLTNQNQIHLGHHRSNVAVFVKS